MESALRSRIVRLLSPYDPLRIAVFGSYARGEETVDSDLDILVAFKHQLGLLELVEIEQELTESLNVKVDLIAENSLKDPLLINSVKRNLVQIYG